MFDFNVLKRYEPNREFWGRNWNAGEVIELVLRTHSNNWLPFTTVCSVFLHELCHIKHMNHGPAFWKLYGELKKELNDLIQRGYTGEGFWSRGWFTSGETEIAVDLSQKDIPEQVCGGVWRRRRRRKREQTSKKKRMGKGKKVKEGGQTLGSDPIRRYLLEGKLKTNPRVSQSKRSRDLSANAALRRFESNATNQKNQNYLEKNQTSGSDSDSGNEYEIERVEWDHPQEQLGMEMEELKSLSGR